VFRHEPSGRPTGIRFQHHFDQIAKQIREGAGQHDATQIMGIASDTDLRSTADRRLGEYHRAPLTDFFKISRNRPAASTQDCDKLGAKVAGVRVITHIYNVCKAASTVKRQWMNSDETRERDHGSCRELIDKEGTSEPAGPKGLNFV
jgi:hypothetical protein